MKKSAFEELKESVRQAGQIRRGERRASRRTIYKPADIRAIRERLGLSQSRFAMLIGISVSTLQNWEQGRRVPDGPAQMLLRVADRHPDALLDALPKAS
jgi:putative transcriptional regulator